MMLYELIRSISREKLEKHLSTIYNKKGVAFYLGVFDKLNNTEVKECDKPLEILVFEGYPFADDDITYIIEGVDYKKDIDKVPSSYKELEEYASRYSFSLTPWGECLSFKVNKQSLVDFLPETLLCLIMEELTEFGSSEDVILEERDSLFKALEEAEKDIKEGRTYTLEELGYLDKRTQEEKDEEHRKMEKQVAYNLNKYYKYMKKEA